MKTNVIISIDIGLNGGISVLDKNKQIMEVMEMPVFKTIVNRKERNILDVSFLSHLFKTFIQKYNVESIIAEKMVAMPNQASQTAMSLGHDRGVFQTIALYNDIPFIEYLPREWQKEMFKGYNYDKSQTKEISIQVATKLYPGRSFKRSEKCKKYHDGMTDSVLIGLYHLSK